MSVTRLVGMIDRAISAVLHQATGREGCSPLRRIVAVP